MKPVSPKIVVANAAEADRVISTVVLAFSNDPFVRWMMPGPEQYLNYFAAAVRFFAGAAFDHASVYRTDDYRSVALWMPPGVHPENEPLVELMQSALGEDVQEDAFSVFGMMGETHPEKDHWYLPMIGVDPSCQGKGYGSALLERSLQDCDNARLPAYLESTSERNIPLYERYGFSVTSELRSGGSPPVWPMLRAAR